MKSRIRGGVAARAAVGMAERGPVPLQATDVVGPYANKLIKLQNDRRRRGGSQSIDVHFHPGAQGVVGIVNHDKAQTRGGDEK